tara:strand:- start:248 stop:922 length:675 start_codon:yes stop_codon:yes gene_type:complete
MAKINSYILLLFFALLSSLSFSQIPPLYNTLFEDEFYTDTLVKKWSISTDSKYSLTKQNGYLHLSCQDTKNQGINLISITAITNYLQATTTLNFNPKINGEQAGIYLYQNNENHLLFKLKKEDNENVLVLQNKLPNQPLIIQKDLVLNKYQNHLELKIGTINENYYFYYRLKSNDLWEIVDSLPINVVSKTNSPPKIGLFTSSDNQPSKNYAAFDLFRYYELKQ